MLVTSHMAWGFVLGRFSAKLIGSEKQVDPSVLLIAGALSDLDLLTFQPPGTIFGHHGLFHSWLAITVLFIPILAKSWRNGLPYYVACVQHPVFGDFVTNEIPLTFPASLDQTGLRLANSFPVAAVALEIAGFAVFFVLKRLEDTSNVSRLARLASALVGAPLLALTIGQALLYYSNELLISIYAIYAVTSAVVLAAIFVERALSSTKNTKP